jgi:3-hydroxyacyl-[acyl-carrier-protein] dehydratase
VQQSVEIHFAGDHPTAAGHFPDNPIIPGALLLDEVVHAVIGLGDGRDAIAIRSAKFFRPVRPGESMRLQWLVLANGATTFECHVMGADSLIATGTIEIRRMPR